MKRTPKGRTTTETPVKCLVPDCDRETEIRGLCRPCYNRAYQLVMAGRTTWEALEERGKIETRKKITDWLLGE